MNKIHDDVFYGVQHWKMKRLHLRLRKYQLIHPFGLVQIAKIFTQRHQSMAHEQWS